MSTNKPTKEEILQTLPNFYGTEHYYKWSPLFPDFVLTDGAKYIADSCGAYWLMDAIASHRARYKHEEFVVISFAKYGSAWKLQFEDGNDHIIARQTIQFSDFPLDEIKLYLVKGVDLWVIELPSEY